MNRESVIDLLRGLGGAFQHRVRAALTLLGIVIGTGSIVLLASVVRGGEAYLVHASQEAEDSDVVEVYGQEPPAAQQDKTTRPLSRGDGEALAKAIPLALVSPESSFDTFATREGRRKRVAIVSANASTLSLYRLRLAMGRALDDADQRGGARVCVIGSEVHDELLRKVAVGARAAPSEIMIEGHLFQVVGVLANKPMIGNTDSTYMWNRKVLVPEATYDAIRSPDHSVDRIYVRSASTAPTHDKRDRALAARTTTRGVILRRHFGVANFTLSKDQSGGTEALVLMVIQILLIGSGGLALLASGINIMNVMLVTVSERKKEIGLRRAIGATSRAIMTQFLLEAAALSFVGALLGVAVGSLAAWGAATLARAGIGFWELTIPTWSLVVGVLLAVVTGLVFGLAPAWRASRISPIEALRAD